MEERCLTCEKNCKNLIVYIFWHLKTVLKEDKEWHQIDSNKWVYELINYKTILEHTFFDMVKLYHLSCGEKMKIGTYAREKYVPSSKNIDNLSYSQYQSTEISDYAEYKRITRFIADRNKLHKISEETEYTQFELEIVDYIVNNLRIHADKTFLNYLFLDLMPPIKNFPNKTKLKLAFDNIQDCYNEILNSNEPYFIKTIKFELIEQYTYFEHYYYLAKILKKQDKEVREKYAYYAYNLRYVIPKSFRKIQNNKKLKRKPIPKELKNIKKYKKEKNNLYYLFLNDYYQLINYFITCPIEHLPEICKLLGLLSTIRRRVARNTLILFGEILVELNFDFSKCPCSENFFKMFIGEGQHINLKQENYEDIYFKDLRTMYAKERSYEEYEMNQRDAKKKKAEYNKKATKRTAL